MAGNCWLVLCVLDAEDLKWLVMRDCAQFLWVELLNLIGVVSSLPSREHILSFCVLPASKFPVLLNFTGSGR